MSYIQIQIGGRLRGLKFNQIALEEVTKNSSEINAFGNIYAMFWGGLVGNAYAKREEVDFTFEQTNDWVDELPKETKEKTIVDVSNCMMETQLYRDLLDAGQKVLDGKKKVKKNSSKSALKT